VCGPLGQGLAQRVFLIDKGQAMETVTICLPADVVQRLSAEAEEKGLTVGDLGGLIVAAWVRSNGVGLEESDSFRDQ